MTHRLRKTILGRKLGMSQIYDAQNAVTPVTLIEAGPCTVLQVKTEEKDGYSALQVGYLERARPPKKSRQNQAESQPQIQPESTGPSFKRVKKPQQGLFRRTGVSPKKVIREIPPFQGKQLAVGDTFDVSVLAGVPAVDVSGVTRGRGFSGLVRRWNHKIGPKSHGSKSKRLMGSTGMHQDPGRVIKGKKYPGQYGAENVKMRNLAVVKIDVEQNLLLVKGAVPGPKGGVLYIEESLGSLVE